MINPNPRANTVISQSFIASEFQGYSDPFTKGEPTSSLNQFVRSKQTSDSGFIQEGESQAFGFGNITNNEPKQLESFSRKANEPVVMGVAKGEEGNNRSRLESYDDESGQGNQPRKLQQQFMQVPQQFNQRYVSPNVVKTDSPTKRNQFPQQSQNSPRPFTNPQPVYNQSPLQNSSFKQPSSSTQGYSNQASRTQVLSQQSRPQYFSNQSQYSQPQLTSSQLGSSNLNGQKSSVQQNLETSSVGKRFKLNVSQEFSNSFVLKCVNEPQKSTILLMKQRQRQFRKSIQNFFV